MSRMPPLAINELSEQTHMDPAEAALLEFAKATLDPSHWSSGRHLPI